MENLNNRKKEKIFYDLELLRKSIVKYFKCTEEDVKILEVKFDDRNYTATISYNYIDWNRSDLRRFIYSTCYFEITGEYGLKGTFRYEGYFYKYENLSSFLMVISKEIEELKNK